eukprot:m.73149 g.73149  ORF g.73149 m.73149 type:complete len:620 (+) comp13025_c0_seq1:112-1971(+)
MMAARQGEAEGPELEANLFFDAFAEDDLLSRDVLLQEIGDAGLQLDDPRLVAMHTALKKLPARLSREQFVRAVGDQAPLVRRAAAGELVLPEYGAFCREFNAVFETIPEAVPAESPVWGAAFCTTDGQRHGAGDCKTECCLQEIISPILYALALEQCGEAAVHTHIGREHSGGRHSDIAVNRNKLPYNPLTEGGRIIATSLIKSTASHTERYAFIKSEIRKMAGGQKTGFSQETNLAHHENLWHLKAIAHFLRDCGATPKDFKLDTVVSLYLQLCATEITPEIGAVIAATLANGGVCPLTNVRVLDPKHVRDTLALMHTCGMDTQSGEWAFSVGIAAKNASSGCIFAVVPGVMGLCTLAPQLNPYHVSERGSEFFRRLVRRFTLGHISFLSSGPASATQKSIASAARKIDPLRFVHSEEEATCSYLMSAAREGDLGAIMSARSKGVTMTMVDYNGRTALHVAAAAGHAQVVDYLIACFPRVQLQDHFGSTPLEDAVRNNNTLAAAMLRRAVGEPLSEDEAVLEAAAEVPPPAPATPSPMATTSLQVPTSPTPTNRSSFSMRRPPSLSRTLSPAPPRRAISLEASPINAQKPASTDPKPPLVDTTQSPPSTRRPSSIDSV